jgi:hypothetical protein
MISYNFLFHRLEKSRLKCLNEHFARVTIFKAGEKSGSYRQIMLGGRNPAGMLHSATALKILIAAVSKTELPHPQR